MRARALLVVVVLAAAATQSAGKQADKEFAVRQLAINRLFTKLENLNHDQEQREIGNKFSFNPELFTNPQAVKNFQSAFQFGFLPRGEVFNYFNPNHLQQAIQLFDVFYFAKDYDSFYQAACWARDRINEGQFAYALSVAVLNRPDTQGIQLLPPAEVEPSLFINSRLIQQAKKNKQQGNKKAFPIFNSTNDFNYNMAYLADHPVPSEFPFDKINQNERETESQYNQYIKTNMLGLEIRLFYFYQDVNLHQQFYLEQLKNPSWFNSQKYPQSKALKKNQNNGENFYYYLQQLLALYDIVRHTNDLGNMQPLLFDEEIPYGFVSELQYSNGLNVLSRPNNYPVKYANPSFLQQAKNIDRRIAEAVDSSTVLKADGTRLKLDAQNGIEVLGNLIQNNENSVNPDYYTDNGGYYGYLDILRKTVGSLANPFNQDTNSPSAMESNGMVLRDIAFYEILSRVVNHFQNFKNKLQPYTKEQLGFPGVKIKGVTTDKLVNSFRNFKYNLFNAIDYTKEEQPQHFDYFAYVRQLFPNTFNIQIQVASDTETPAVVRVFIASKYNARNYENSLEQARLNFVEIDRFVVNLKSGDNNIVRNSLQSTRFVQPPEPTDDIYHKALQLANGGAPYEYDENINQREAAFPYNLILPKGYTFGQTHIIAVAINPFQGEQPGPQEQPKDGRPQGFPFDRVVADETIFQEAENIFFKTADIFLKFKEDSKSKKQ